MTQSPNSAKPAAADRDRKAEAENLVRHLLAAMDALVATVEQETSAGARRQAQGGGRARSHQVGTRARSMSPTPRR